MVLVLAIAVISKLLQTVTNCYNYVVSICKIFLIFSVGGLYNVSVDAESNASHNSPVRYIKERIMTVKEKIVSNIDVHGLKFAAQWCKKNRIPFDTFYFVLFRRYPTK